MTLEPRERVTTADPVQLEQYIEACVERKVSERFARLQESIDQALAQVRTTSTATLTDRATLLVFSGELDRAMAAFIIATGAAAMGMDVSMFFTFWGLPILKKTTIRAGKTVPEKLLATMLPTGPEHAGTSKLHMLGLGPRLLKKIMRQHNVETLPALMTLARDLGVRLIACQMTMGIMGITREELLDGLDYGGVATYLADAGDSRITLFI
jgi:peroxiredoxin family protein